MRAFLLEGTPLVFYDPLEIYPALGFNCPMTAQEKTALARFLNKAAAYLDSGYEEQEAQVFDEELSEQIFTNGEAGETGDFSSLPLAYQVEEEDLWEPLDSGNPMDSGNPTDSLGGSASLESLTNEIKTCAACSLGRTRTRAVPGEGSEKPLVLVIGEGPGAEEDTSGRPFVGKAGQLLDRMLASIGLFREKNCYIANILKCRPPNNRDPQTDEIQNCVPFLERQIRLLKPGVILCAGRFAAQFIFGSSKGINLLRGSFGEYVCPSNMDEELSPIPVLATYHPSAILRDESLRRPAFEDMKLLMARLAGLDRDYAGEVKELLLKYASTDEEFARRLRLGNGQGYLD